MSKTSACLVLIFLILTAEKTFGYPYELGVKQESLYWLSGLSLLYLGDQNKQQTRPTAQELAELDAADVPYYDRPYAGHWNEAASTESDFLLAAGIILPGGFI
ncbi:MAG: hypothetical protein HQ517_08440, partial [SAR324 cluster bacterium]|nr:hypothetical protein [SAR324 cluster bacterium]